MAPSLQLKYVNKLVGLRVLILGGTSGIGFAVASAVLEHGATVIVSSSNPEKVENAIKRLKEAYPDPDYHARVAGYPCDLGNPETVEQNLVSLLDRATEHRTALLDHIVLTAGDPINFSPIEEISIEYINRSGHVRFVAPLILAKLARKYMKIADSSSITLTAGAGIFRPVPQWSVLIGYGAGIDGFRRGLSVDLAPIRVNVVCPGAIHTEFFNVIPKEALEATVEKLAKETLLNRVGQPEDVAEAYLYFMKDKFATGTMVFSDGGKLKVMDVLFPQPYLTLISCSYFHIRDMLLLVLIIWRNEIRSSCVFADVALGILTRSTWLVPVNLSTLLHYAETLCFRKVGDEVRIEETEPIPMIEGEEIS